MSSPSPTDFIGIIALLGGEIAENSAKFANTHLAWRFMTSYFVVPGLYKLAILLLKRNKYSTGLALSSGIREDRRKIAGFKGSNKYKYIGMSSGTNAPVLNAVYEAYLNAIDRELEEVKSRFFRNDIAKDKEFKLRYVSVNDNNFNKVIYFYKGWVRLAITIFLQACAIVAIPIAICCFDDNTAGTFIAVGITGLNFLSYFLIVFVVAINKFHFASNAPAEDVPSGNSIVTDMWNNNVWAVNAKEKVIQDLLRDEIVTEKETYNMCNHCNTTKCCSFIKHNKIAKIYSNHKNMLEFIVALLGCATTVATVLTTPIMSFKGKILLAVELFIGLLASMVFSSRDNESTLHDIAKEYYEIRPLKRTIFTNRATAIAAATFFTKGDPIYIGETLLPRTAQFNSYRDILGIIIRKESVRDQLKSQIMRILPSINIESNNSKEELVYILTKNIQHNAFTVLINGYNIDHDDEKYDIDYNKWPQRLLIDIIEAFVHVYVTQTEEPNPFIHLLPEDFHVCTCLYV